MTVYTTALRLREATNLIWTDIDFAQGQVKVTRKDAAGFVQSWQPKDHEMREIPVPPQVASPLTELRASAPEGCPYVFMDAGRWDFYRQHVDAGEWADGRDLVNNMLRRFQTLCRHAGVGPYTIHDLRRSCITNWARVLPIHVVQKLAGHSDIKTTQKHYLSIQQEDTDRAKKAQGDILDRMPPQGDRQPMPKRSTPRRTFPGKKKRGDRS